MNPKEKADCLIELHKTKMDHFIQTRTIEFQVNIAIWTLIVVAGSFFYQSRIHLIGCGLCNYYEVAQVVFLIHLFWMILIQRSENIDHDCMHHYRQEIAKLSGVPELEIKNQWPIWGCGWVILEVSMTLFLLYCVGIVLSI